ncbi:MAG: triose-phosphate isomerase [Candidatus Harrisonbacteria bacterium CG10_big_fil_rev_8_21_14_0_10_42_17]|uniref:Triosephosphate isomerase n=1 Tax=Candidatus Harrisonbacteria bacterium CG10_big_fil_rev_8_21_14_0_10_42_17 TaxID=1974584 RepID=A0A2M6WHY1_9BACT|nr:MAG: triose-phosphate isomerase [Candidatus Harrisonbacteria bacterium CG10_big_fil_rev_8_21_14_0_10_42_17]
MKKTIIANWKLHPTSAYNAIGLAKSIDQEGVIICPPSPFLESVKGAISKAKLGGQDCFWESEGAYTGEVSPKTLASLGAEFVIIGHSSRRKLGETDGIVNRKIIAAINNNLIPIVCIGESKADYDAGRREETITKQITAGFKAVPTTMQKRTITLFVAYEPMWAISTEAGAKPETPEEALAMIEYMKTVLEGMSLEKNTKMIYGGSVTEENAESLLHHKGIEGALIGSASLKPDIFNNIVEIAKKYE